MPRSLDLRELESRLYARVDDGLVVSEENYPKHRFLLGTLTGDKRFLHGDADEQIVAFRELRAGGGDLDLGEIRNLGHGFLDVGGASAQFDYPLPGDGFGAKKARTVELLRLKYPEDSFRVRNSK